MAKHNINSILGGISHSYFFGQEGSYSGSCGIDPERRINGRISGAISPTPMSEDGAGGYIFLQENDKNDNTYYLKPTGEFGIYGGALLNTFTSGNGMAYYNNYYYIADATDIHRYGPLDGTPAIEENWWTSISQLDQTIQAIGGTKTIAFGGVTRISQSIDEIIDCKKIKLGLQNTGTDTSYKVKVEIRDVSSTTVTPMGSTYEQFNYTRKEPGNELLASAVTDAPGNTMEIVEVEFDDIVKFEEEVCLVITTENIITEDQSFNVMISELGDVYPKGMMSYFDGSWATQPVLVWDDNTGTHSGTNEIIYTNTVSLKDEGIVEGDFKIRFRTTLHSDTDYWYCGITRNGSVLSNSLCSIVVRDLDNNIIFQDENRSIINNNNIGGDYAEGGAKANNNVYIDFTIKPTAEIEHGDIIGIDARAIDNTDGDLVFGINVYRPEDSFKRWPYFYYTDNKLAEDAYVNILLDERENLYITTSKDIKYLEKETDSWNSLWNGTLERLDLDENYPAIIKHLGSGGTLLLANNNLLHTMIATAVDPTEVDENRLIFDSTHFVNWVGVTSTSVFLGLQHKGSETLPSQVVYYEPAAERTRIFSIPEGATMGFIKNENCHIIDKKGQMRVFTGSAFQTYSYFPPYYRGEEIETLPHRNGITVKGDIVKIAWKGQYPDPSGVWVYENENLYHKQSLVFDKTTLNSLGAIELEDIGAIYEEDELYLGASVLDGTGSEIKGVYSTSKTAVSDENRATITTSKMISPEINNIWQDIALKYRNGEFIVKQKIEADIEETELSGTWTAANTFTCTDDISALQVGDEVIVRKGQGAGLHAHIISITGTTIVIDEGLTAVTSGTFTFSCERWAKINLDYKADKLSAKAGLKDQKLENAQFKIDMRGTLEEMQIKSIIDKTLKK